MLFTMVFNLFSYMALLHNYTTFKKGVLTAQLQFWYVHKKSLTG